MLCTWNFLFFFRLGINAFFTDDALNHITLQSGLAPLLFVRFCCRIYRKIPKTLENISQSHKTPHHSNVSIATSSRRIYRRILERLRGRFRAQHGPLMAHTDMVDRCICRFVRMEQLGWSRYESFLVVSWAFSRGIVIL